VTCPKRPWKKFCDTVSVLRIRTSMPSYASSAPSTLSGSTMSVGAIAAVPSTVMPDALMSCVDDRPVDGSPNSDTTPVTRSSVPGCAIAGGALEVNTKRPSDVAASPSPSRSCTKKPLPVRRVTTPEVVTVWPTSGLTAALPWIW